jgi:hypothetical protein
MPTEDFSLASLIFQIISCVVLTATLFAVVAYTRATFQQAEGIQKPFVCLLTTTYLDVDHPRILETESDLVVGDFVLVNRGNGPAVKLRCRIDFDRPSSPFFFSVPHLGPRSRFNTREPQEDRLTEPKRVVLRTIYESMTGQLYETRECLERQTSHHYFGATGFQFRHVPLLERRNVRKDLTPSS